jgi:hypothetical protein
MDLPLSGGCFCGAIRYRCPPPAHSPAYCHCESCRRAVGAHAVAWFTVGVETLEFESATPAEFNSSAGVRRGHCASCGTTLTYWNAAQPATIDVTVASLDTPARVEPRKHIWMEDAVAGDSPGDGLPQFARSSADAKLKSQLPRNIR